MEKETIEIEWQSLCALAAWMVDAIGFLPFSEESKPAVDALFRIRPDQGQQIEIVNK